MSPHTVVLLEPVTLVVESDLVNLVVSRDRGTRCVVLSIISRYLFSIFSSIGTVSIEPFFAVCQPHATA
jgi:hypothetical protein